jgi:uncharacterized protein (TIGR00730 family)
MLKRVCIFCGTSAGTSPVYRQKAIQIGEILASRGVGIVYGGGSVGLMGAVAEAGQRAGAEVIGIITKDLLDIEIANKAIPRLCVVGSMHERKALMADLSDGFIAMPGGFGTLEEFMEVVTWSQLGVHRKPCGLLNVNGYYDFLLNMCDHAVKEGFITPVDRRLVIADPEPESLIDRLNKFDVPPPSKWLSLAET